MLRNLVRQPINHFMKSNVLSTATIQTDNSAIFFPFSCFIIEADATDHNRVIGHLKVNPEFPIDIDYEEYEVIYLAIFVTDLNQEVNEGTSDGTFFLIEFRLNRF